MTANPKSFPTRITLARVEDLRPSGGKPYLAELAYSGLSEGVEYVRADEHEKALRWVDQVASAAFFGATAPDASTMQFTITLTAAEWRAMRELVGLIGPKPKSAGMPDGGWEGGSFP
jgi:hypothetical protein